MVANAAVGGSSKHTAIVETEVTVVTDDNVIKDAHAHDIADFF